MGTVIIIPDADFSENAIEKINLNNPLLINIDLQGNVTITGEGAVDIYYTINGDTPTENSNKYTNSFSVEPGTIIKAICTYEDGSTSEVVSDIYGHYNHFNWGNGGIDNQNAGIVIASDTANTTASTIGKALYATTDVVLSVNDTENYEILGYYINTTYTGGQHLPTLTIPAGNTFAIAIANKNGEKFYPSDGLKRAKKTTLVLQDICRRLVGYTGTIRMDDQEDSPSGYTMLEQF